MTKDEIIHKISENTGLNKKTVGLVVENFITSIKDNMSEGNNIYIRGFGSFLTAKKARKVARNISKNLQIVIEPHYAPKFRPSEAFIQQVKTSVNDQNVQKRRAGRE